MTRRESVVILVMAALKILQKTDKPTIRKIFAFITKCSPQKTPKRMIVAALKRCVEFGIMKQKRGHYFLSCYDDQQKVKLEDLKTTSEIPLSLKNNVLKFKLPKVIHPKNESICLNVKKNENPLRIKKEKSQLLFLTKQHSICDLYKNPEYKDSQCSIMYTISHEMS
ncbi:uncharacterized protein LOC122505798 [Leptopilina heterotoma]|uniref:uncharacterized protein LOC122505798 n=1 Tax=Leptopilina heterotoma TaxID=63436 RepID=UPI001CA96685|nr:uncharacterized protein LOC122505798 [Leptopilina heterotoma]